MKAKTLKRAGIFMLSAMVALTMGATVFAAPSSNPLSGGSEFTFNKDLKGINDSIASIAGPGVTFEYAVEPVAPSSDNGGTSITDQQGHSAVVTQGPAGGLSFKNDVNTIVYAKSEMLNASAAGATNISNDKPREVTLVADIDAFKVNNVIQPGIYRYQLGESTDPSTLPAGVTNSNDQTRYVDVYVTTSGIAGISMHNGDLTSGKQAFPAASYETKNVCVKKVVEGAMADPDAVFDFTATVSDNTRAFYSGTTEAGASTLQAAGTTSVTATLANNGELWLCGLAPDAQVGFSEVNTFGGNTYSPAYSDGASISGSTNTMAAANLANDTVVTFTNTLDSVSPTGVVMKFGAPLLVLLAGLALVVINRRNRKASDVQ